MFHFVFDIFLTLLISLGVLALVVLWVLLVIMGYQEFRQFMYKREQSKYDNY